MSHDRTDTIRLPPDVSRCEPSGSCVVRGTCARYQAAIPAKYGSVTDFSLDANGGGTLLNNPAFVPGAVPLDPTYKPETVNAFELGAKTEYWGGRARTNISLFYYDISNYKYVAKSQSNKVTGETDYYYDSANIAQKGLEIGVSGQLSENFSYNASYAYLHINDKSVSKTLPSNSATVMLNYKNRDYLYNITAKHLGGYSQSATNGTGMGNYLRIDASISRVLKDKSKITLYGKNITNQHYAEAYQNGAASGMLGYIYNRGSVFGIEYSKDF